MKDLKILTANNYFNELFDGLSFRLNETIDLHDLCSMDKSEELKKIRAGFYTFQKSIFYFTHKKGKILSNYGYITKKADFSLNLLSKIVEITKKVTTEETYKLKFRLESKSNEAKELLVTTSEVSKVVNLDEQLSKHGIYRHSLTDKDLKELLNGFDYTEIPTIYYSNNAGHINLKGKDLWLSQNDLTYYFGNELDENLLVKLSKNAASHPKIVNIEKIANDNKFKSYLNEASNYYSCNLPPKTEQQVILSLFYYLNKTYKEKIEAILIVSLSVMAPFVNMIFEKFRGFPIGYLEGDSATGKTNVLNIISYMYGLDTSYPKSGNDTGLNILFHLSLNNSRPLLLNEIGDPLRPKINELLIKPVYDRTPRRRMQKSGSAESMTAINSTLIFNTNQSINKETAITNRLLHTYWKKGNFEIQEAKKYNEFLEYLSCTIPYIIHNTPTEAILDLIETYMTNERLLKISDDRHRLNISVAFTGLKILIDKMNIPELSIKQFTPRLEAFICDYEKNAQVDELDRFWLVLRDVISSTKYELKEGLDYKVVLHNGERGLHIYTGKKAEKFKTAFAKAYKHNYEGSRSLKISEYIEKLKSIYGVTKESATYTGESKYGLFIAFSKYPDIEYWLNKNDNSMPSDYYTKKNEDATDWNNGEEMF